MQKDRDFGLVVGGPTPRNPSSHVTKNSPPERIE